MADKITLTNKKSITFLTKRPIKVNIGTDVEGFFKRLTLDEFFDVQSQLMSVEAKGKELEAEQGKDEMTRTREIATYSKKVMVDLMIKIMTDENGERAFKEEDRTELETLVSPQFTSDFISAFMSSQGVTDKKEIASAEADFPKKS